LKNSAEVEPRTTRLEKLAASQKATGAESEQTVKSYDANAAATRAMFDARGTESLRRITSVCASLKWCPPIMGEMTPRHFRIAHDLSKLNSMHLTIIARCEGGQVGW
jgi:hypothetical protein